MSFLDEAKAEAQLRNGPRCSVAVLYEDHADLEADLRTLFADSDVTTAAIWRALHKRGISIAEKNLNRHRKGLCLCPD